MASSQKTMSVQAGNASATVRATVNDNMPEIPCPDPAGYKYVGARYVPLFADPLEWDRETAYEPLTIVVHEGNSYTSKTFVPVGMDITNGDYWALTGNYNAQVEQYREEVKQYDERISALEGDNTFLKDHVRTKFLVLGDSWSDQHFNADTHQWVEIYANRNNMTATNYAEGGAGFVTNTIAEHTIPQQADLAIANISDPENYREVIIIGGVNDTSENINNNKVAAALNQTLKKVNAKFPNANIKIASNTGSDSDSKAYTLNTAFFNNSNESLNTQMYDLFHLFYRSDTYFSEDDHLHPNTKGARLIANTLMGQPIQRVYDHRLEATIENAGEGSSVKVFVFPIGAHSLVIMNMYIISNGITNMVNVKLPFTVSETTYGQLLSVESNKLAYVQRITSASDTFTVNLNGESGVVPSGHAYYGFIVGIW